MRVCIVEASGKLGQYVVQLAPDRGHEVVGVCRERSVGKLVHEAPAIVGCQTPSALAHAAGR